jgi:hypothetical protein
LAEGPSPSPPTPSAPIPPREDKASGEARAVVVDLVAAATMVGMVVQQVAVRMSLVVETGVAAVVLATLVVVLLAELLGTAGPASEVVCLSPAGRSLWSVTRSTAIRLWVARAVPAAMEARGELEAASASGVRVEAAVFLVALLGKRAVAPMEAMAAPVEMAVTEAMAVKGMVAACALWVGQSR